MAIHSSILARIIHGQRSLEGYSPWGGKELDMTEHARKQGKSQRLGIDCGVPVNIHLY